MNQISIQSEEQNTINNINQEKLNQSSDDLKFSHFQSQIRKWKLMAFVFLGFFIGSLFANFISPFAIPYSAFKNGNLISIGGVSWIKVDEVVFNGYILTDKNCLDCNLQMIETILRQGLSPTLQSKIVDLNEDLGKKLAQNFKVSSLPMIFFDSTVKKLKSFDRLQPLLVEKEGYYNLDIAFLGIAPDIFYEKPTVNESHPFLGSKDAPVTIYEFIDYQCPYCKKFADETLPKIKSDYIDKNKVNVVFKDFPLDVHRNALAAAQAARCAHNQNKFKQMHDLIFETQDKWSSLTPDKALNYFANFSSKLALNSNQFKSCLKDENIKNAILADFREGKDNFKISGTPGFLINQKGVSGALSFEEFAKIIDRELLKVTK